MTTPPPDSSESYYCEVCNGLVAQSAQGKLNDIRRRNNSQIPFYQFGIYFDRTVIFKPEHGDQFTGGIVKHGQARHEALKTANVRLIHWYTPRTGNYRYVIKLDDEAIVGILTQETSINGVIQTFEALSNNLPPKRIELVIQKIVRNPKIAQSVKENNQYICEVCGRKPFLQKNGKLYAEADHIRPLGGSNGGLDTPENMRCVCAQCHAIITHGSDEVVNELLKSNQTQL